jgi:hypothetical protein
MVTYVTLGISVNKSQVDFFNTKCSKCGEEKEGAIVLEEQK